MARGTLGRRWSSGSFGASGASSVRVVLGDDGQVLLGLGRACCGCPVAFAAAAEGLANYVKRQKTRPALSVIIFQI